MHEAVIESQRVRIVASGAVCKAGRTFCDVAHGPYKVHESLLAVRASAKPPDAYLRAVVAVNPYGIQHIGMPWQTRSRQNRRR